MPVFGNSNNESEEPNTSVITWQVSVYGIYYDQQFFKITHRDDFVSCE